MKANNNEKINIFEMLWRRKYFYLLGYLIGIACVLLSKALGSTVGNDQVVIIPISLSFAFGFILYILIEQPKRLNKEGRILIFSKEGLIHFGLAFISMFVLGLAFKALN